MLPALPVLGAPVVPWGSPGAVMGGPSAAPLQLVPLHPAEPPEMSLYCIRDLSSNNKGNGQEIRDK